MKYIRYLRNGIISLYSAFCALFFSTKDRPSKIKSFFNVHSGVYKLSLVSFFIQLGSTLVHTTSNQFIVKELKLLSENEMVLIKTSSETVSTFCKVIAGYLSDLFRNRKHFLILGYSSVVFFKFCFSVCTVTWLLPFWFCRNFFIFTHFTDRVFNSFRDGAKDAFALDVSTKEQTAAAFAVRKMLASFGSVFGGIVAFILLNHYNLSATWMCSLSLIPTGIASIMAMFLIKDVIVNKPIDKSKQIIQKVLIGIFFLVSVIFTLSSHAFAIVIFWLFLLNVNTEIFATIKNKTISNNAIMIFVLLAVYVGGYFINHNMVYVICSLAYIAFFYFQILEDSNIEKNNNVQNYSYVTIPVLSLAICGAMILIPTFKETLLTFMTPQWFTFGSLIYLICMIIFFIVLYVKNNIHATSLQLKSFRKTIMFTSICGTGAFIMSYLTLFSFNVYLFSIIFVMFSSIFAIRKTFMETPIFKTVSNREKMAKFIFVIPLILLIVCGRLNENMYWVGSKSATITEKHFPLLFSLSYLFISIFSLLFGILLKRKRIIIGLLTTIISMMAANLLTMHPTTIKTVFAMMCFGCSAAGTDVVISYLVCKTIPSEETRATVLGLFYTITGFFSFLAGIAMCNIKATFGTPKAFMASSIFGVIAIIYIICVFTKLSKIEKED